MRDMLTILCSLLKINSSMHLDSKENRSLKRGDHFWRQRGKYRLQNHCLLCLRLPAFKRRVGIPTKINNNSELYRQCYSVASLMTAVNI